MAFSYRINTEVLYYQNAINHMEKALPLYEVRELVKNYGCDNETTYEEILPATKESLNNAIQAVINFACCAESCYNLSINEYYRNNHIKHDCKKLLRLPVPNKIKQINIFYTNIIPQSLIADLLLLSKVRNAMVHYSEPVVYCGGNVMGEQFHLLKRVNLIKFRQSVDALLAIFHQKSILDSDIRCPSAPVIGEGDIIFE